MAEAEARPWVRLAELLERGDPSELEGFFAALPATETARVFANLEPSAQQQVLTLLTPADAAAAIEEIPDIQAGALVAELPSQEAAAIVSELPSHEQADLLSEMELPDAEAILAEMAPEEAERARLLTSYAADQAGGLMVAEYLSYPVAARVQDVLEDLRAHAELYSRYDVQYAYVTGQGERLVGVLPLRDLLLAPHDRPIRSFMIPDPVRIQAEAAFEEVKALFETHRFYGVPVVGEGDRLVGVIRRMEVAEALEARVEQEHLRSRGIVGGEELRTMPVLLRSGRRLSWLSVNVVLNLIAASVIAFYQDTLTAVIALAVFLPIISDMSGCSGNQAVAVSMREITLGLIQPVDAFRVWLKEVAVGALNGVALGLLVAGAAWVWIGNPWLGAVVGAAMALNTVVAVSIGGVVPLLLKRMQFDPALASGPILTTITDMCGFFLLLGMATVLLSRLVAV